MIRRRLVQFMAVFVAGAALACPGAAEHVDTGAAAGLLPATFVHQVGRVWEIEQWLAKEYAAVPIAIVPIMHRGNPAFRVLFVAGSARPGGGEGPERMLIIDAGSLQPIEPHIPHGAPDS